MFKLTKDEASKHLVLLEAHMLRDPDKFEKTVEFRDFYKDAIEEQLHFKKPEWILLELMKIYKNVTVWSFLGQAEGDGSPDSLAGSSDDGGLVLEFEIHVLLLRVFQG